MARWPDPCDPWRLFSPAPAPAVLGTFPPGAHFPAWLALYRPLPRAWGSPELTPTLLPLPCPASPLARLTCPSSPCSQMVPGLLQASESLLTCPRLTNSRKLPGLPPELLDPAHLPKPLLLPGVPRSTPASQPMLTCPISTCSQALPGVLPALLGPAHLQKLYLLPCAARSVPCPP